MAENKIVIQIDAKGNANTKIKTLGKGVKDFGKSTVSVFAKASSAFDTFQGVLAANVATAVLRGVKNVASDLFRTFVTDGVRAAQVQEDAINELNAALAASGDFSQEASDDLQNFASELQKSSVIGDETTLKMLALAKSFGASNESAKELVKGGLGLSIAANLSLEEAIRRVGRASSGSIEDIAKFAPEIRNLTKEQLAAGGAAEILAEKFGGLAAQQTQTFSGAITQLQNTFGDLTETTGNSIVKNQTLINVIKTITKEIGSFDEFIKANIGSLQELISKGIIGLIDAGLILIPILQFIGTAGSLAFNTLSLVVNSTLAVIAKGLNLIGVISDTAFKTFQDSATEASESIRETLAGEDEETSPLSKINSLLVTLKESAVEGFTAMSTGAQSTVAPINAAKDTIAGMSEADIKAAKDKQDLIKQINKEILAIDKLNQKEILRTQVLKTQLAEADQLTQVSAGNRVAALQTADEKIVASRFTTIQAIERRQRFASDKEKVENQARIDAILSQEEEGSSRRILIEEKVAQARSRQRQQNLQSAGQAFGNLATLTKTKSRELFIIGKIAAIGQAIVNTALGFTKALAQGGIFGPILGATVLAAGAVQLSIIAAQQPGFQKGIDFVPGVGTSDSFSALLAPGERVVPAKSNEKLTEFLEGGGNAEILLSIDDKLSRLENTTIVNIGNEEIVNQVRNALDDGRVLA